MKRLINTAVVLFSLSGTALADSTIGRTFDISEPDALEEITNKAESKRFDMSAMTKPKDWSALKPVSVPPAPEDRTRQYVPWYTVPFDITDEKGKVIYPKGFVFNPLRYAQMPNKLVFTSPANLHRAIQHAGPYDQVILTSGNVRDLREKTGRELFISDKQLIERLGIQYEPSIVKQKGSHLVITELGPEQADR